MGGGVEGRKGWRRERVGGEEGCKKGGGGEEGCKKGGEGGLGG